MIQTYVIKPLAAVLRTLGRWADKIDPPATDARGGPGGVPK